MPLRFTGRILDHLSHSGYVPQTAADMAGELRVRDHETHLFEEAVRLLDSGGRIEVGDDGRLRLPRMPDDLVGTIRVNQRGFGFVIPDHPLRDGDLFIPATGIGDAVSGDRVRARVTRRVAKGRNGKPMISGHVVEVLERKHTVFTGTLRKEAGNWLVEPDGRALREPVVIRDPHAKNAKVGDKVVFELVHYPEADYMAEGVITEVLGEAGRPDVETQAVIEAHHLRTEFPPECVEEARAATKRFEAVASSSGAAEGREDLRDDFVFTIDPPDARDFDDAISIGFDERTRRWTLGVHIADVSTFVRRGTALDEEATTRGNSVYLPRLVLPMLPEVLSNGICSLQEGVIRFTKSAFMQFDERGAVVGQRAAATVIKSRHRLTYLEAQALIDGDEEEARRHARTDTPYDDELRRALAMSNKLARLLRDRRARDGMIVLDLPDIELVFDDDGHVVDAVPEDDAFTHKLIEMFMVEANEAIARLFADLGVPVLRRIHPDPSFGDLNELRTFARAAGRDVPEEPTRHDLQRLLDATRGNPAGRAVHFAVLRTLAKASYSPALIGHYALASEHYAHFTSPIRRYPDLSTHRALEAYLEFTQNGRKVPKGKAKDTLARRIMSDERGAREDDLVALGRHCSDTELEAEAAERSLRQFLVLQFLMEKHLGDVFDGVVTGVASRGVFVSIEQYLIDGLVRVQDLPTPGGRSAGWRPDFATGRLVSRSGAVIGVGDLVKVQLVTVDLASRELDLRLVEMPGREGDGKRGPRAEAGPEKRQRRQRRHQPKKKQKKGKRRKR